MDFSNRKITVDGLRQHINASGIAAFERICYGTGYNLIDFAVAYGSTEVLDFAREVAPQYFESEELEIVEAGSTLIWPAIREENIPAIEYLFRICPAILYARDAYGNNLAHNAVNRIKSIEAIYRLAPELFKSPNRFGKLPIVEGASNAARGAAYGDDDFRAFELTLSLIPRFWRQISPADLRCWGCSCMCDCGCWERFEKEYQEWYSAAKTQAQRASDLGRYYTRKELRLLTPVATPFQNRINSRVLKGSKSLRH